jgi:hypothetical protein
MLWCLRPIGSTSAPPRPCSTSGFATSHTSRQARFSELERQLYEMGDLKNARYRQHLLKAQVTEFILPDRHSVQAVDAWLSEYGIMRPDRVTRRSVAGDWVTALVLVALAEEMLDTVSNLLA